MVGNDPESQLAPYQENNMGDCPEEYLEFNSVEEEKLEIYNSDGIEKVIMPDGRFLNKWDDEFRIKGTIGTGTNTHKVPDHLEIKKVLFKDLYSTFEEYMEDWCGYNKRNDKTGKYGYWENPNRKWDWYQLGGRWSGFFKLKSPNMIGKLGKPSLIYPIVPKDGYVDQAYKYQIDFEGMMCEAGENAKKDYEDVERIFGGNIPKLDYIWKKDFWDDGQFSKLDIDEKRKIYNEQPGCKAYQELKTNIWDDKDNPDRDKIIWMNLDDYQISKEEYIENARNGAFITFAIVKDSKWYERGEMLWFAAVKDEMDKKEWNNKFVSLIMDLPDDTLLSVYDCHI